MEYRIYEVAKKDKIIPVVAIRHYWERERDIYDEIKNAFVLKMYDHLFLFPLDETLDILRDKPATVVDGIYYENGCEQCVHRLQQVTKGCEVCVFQPKEKTLFNIEDLKTYMQVKKAAEINMLSYFTKDNIDSVYKYYNLIPFHKQILVTVEEFTQFLKKLGYQPVLETEQELLYKKGEDYYEFRKTEPFMEEKANCYTKKQLIEIYENIEQEIEELRVKKEKLKTLIGG